MAGDCTFKLNIFQGPLDLLLHLIRVNELEISEISISQITSQYLDYLRLMESLDLEVAGDYLVMAASLINIKLRTLLPDPEEEIEPEAEEELDSFMTARALMQRLIEYRRFKEAAAGLGARAERQAQIFLREVALPQLAEAEASAPVRGDLALLLEAFGRVIKFVERRDYHQVQQENYTIEDKIGVVRRRLMIENGFELEELFLACHDKLEMIVTLMALLELCRLKEILLRQGDTFGRIGVARREGLPTVDDEEARAGEAEELARLETQIIAQRTGFVDDGLLPEDEPEDEPDGEPDAEPAGAAARVIELAPPAESAAETSDPTEEPS